VQIKKHVCIRQTAILNPFAEKEHFLLFKRQKYNMQKMAAQRRKIKHWKGVGDIARIIFTKRPMGSYISIGGRALGEVYIGRIFSKTAQGKGLQ